MNGAFGMLGNRGKTDSSNHKNKDAKWERTLGSKAISIKRSHTYFETTMIL